MAIPSDTNYFRLFSIIQKNIMKALGREPNHFHDEFADVVAYRTWLIFKLDVLLFEYREENDSQRLVLSGRRALDSYLFTKHGIPLHVSRSYSLDDVIILMFKEIYSHTLSDSVLSKLITQSEYQLSDRNFFNLDKQYREFCEAEWDPELADRTLLKGLVV